MYITGLKADGFKNIEKADIFPHRDVNILYGDNAQGKTNLIEAIWMCSGARSFRNTKDRDLIGIGKDRLDVELNFFDGRRTQSISVGVSKENPKEKLVTLNGVRQKTLSSLFGNLICVVFTPEDLELSKGSPEKRRDFLDLSISQLKGSYALVAAKYENALSQRNALLKSIASGSASRETLDIFDIQLSQLGSYIAMLRYNYIKKLSLTAIPLYSEISSGREALELFYQSTVFEELEGRTDYMGDMAEEYMEILKRNLEGDLHSGFTQAGVHRDDLNARINGLNAREFASQGQHRSTALILKLSQAYILAEENGNSPIILLDDILSELDRRRQSFVFSKIRNMQIFITCCSLSEKSPDFSKGSLYHIENGRVSDVSAASADRSDAAKK